MLREIIRSKLVCESAITKQDILSSLYVNRGLKIGKTAKFWRGVSSTSGSGGAYLGLGLYITGSRSEAKNYGTPIEMDRYDLPNNPLRFKNFNEWEIWIQHAARAAGFDGPREFNSAYKDVGEFVRWLDPDIDGIQISAGKDAIFVNYSGRRVGING